MSEIIGEGTYGCVHKPSLKCTRKKQKYDNKVSKLMLHKDANEELKENILISKIDKNKDFSLGKPDKCKPAKTKRNLASINKCEDFDKNDVKDYSLLIMTDGGTNLKQFAKKMHELHNSSENQKKMEIFWIETLRLFYGLLKFNESDIIHYDIKPQNIVYNSETNRLNFIDFGFMTTKDNVKSKIKKSDYNLAIWYWYYPFENMLLNYNEFVDFVNKSTENKKKIMELLKEKAKKTNDTEHFSEFYEYVGDEIKSSNDSKFIELLLKLKMNDYKRLMEKSLDSVDSYGLGISLYYTLRKTLHLIPSELAQSLKDLFENMVTASIYQRYTPDLLIEKYESILEDSGLLKKHNLKIREHMVIKKSQPTLLRTIARTFGLVNSSSSSDNKKTRKNKPIKKNLTRSQSASSLSASSLSASSLSASNKSSSQSLSSDGSSDPLSSDGSSEPLSSDSLSSEPLSSDSLSSEPLSSNVSIQSTSNNSKKKSYKSAFSNNL